MKAICEHVSQCGDAIAEIIKAKKQGTERKATGLMPNPLKFHEMTLNYVASARQILKAKCAKIKVGAGEKVEN